MLNVNWRWNMPQVGSPNEPAQTNQEMLLRAADSIAKGIRERRERQNADMWKQKELDLRQSQLDYGKERDELDRALRERQFAQNLAETRRMNTLNETKALTEMEQKRKERKVLEDLYNKFWGNDPEEQEIAKLRKELGLE